MAEMMHQMKTSWRICLVATKEKEYARWRSQLSAAQDRIGGAERRAKVLDEENVQMIRVSCKVGTNMYAQDSWYVGDFQ